MMADLYNLLGLIYNDQGKYQMAHDYFKQSLTLKINLQDEYSQAMTLFHLGTIQEVWGELNESLQHFTHSLEIATKFQAVRIIAIVLEAIGQIYERLDDSKTAFNYLKESLRLHNKLGNDYLPGSS